MGNLSSTVTESVTGTKSKQPLTPETAGVLGADWQQLAAKAAQAGWRSACCFRRT